MLQSEFHLSITLTTFMGIYPLLNVYRVYIFDSSQLETYRYEFSVSFIYLSYTFIYPYLVKHWVSKVLAVIIASRPICDTFRVTSNVRQQPKCELPWQLCHPVVELRSKSIEQASAGRKPQTPTQSLCAAAALELLATPPAPPATTNDEQLRRMRSRVKSKYCPKSGAMSVSVRFDALINKLCVGAVFLI